MSMPVMDTLAAAVCPAPVPVPVPMAAAPEMGVMTPRQKAHGARLAELQAALQRTELAPSTPAAAEAAEPMSVPWFPTTAACIDNFSTQWLSTKALDEDAGNTNDLDEDHPGFSDTEYRQRRAMIVQLAVDYRAGGPLPDVEYTERERNTWATVYDRLRETSRRHAAREFNELLAVMEEEIGYGREEVPQLSKVSAFLEQRTGFTLRPVGGLVSARDFLNALGLKVFFSTQYLRHHTKPLYTPEPDAVHELFGHVPMFANPEFARFSHEIGMASLGASDEDIKKLGACYTHAVEFGLYREKGALKAFGAALLSSFGELEYACSPTRPAGGVEERPEYLPFDPEVASATAYPVTCYQPRYFVADSFEDACSATREFTATVAARRPFGLRYCEETRTVVPDRPLDRGEYEASFQL